MALGRSLRQGAKQVPAEAAAGVAVAGGVRRTDLGTAGRLVSDDPGHGVAAAVVVAEHLAEEAPDGRDRAEHPVALRDAVLVEDIEDAGFGQNSGKRKPLVPRAAGADRLQAGPGIAFPVELGIVSRYGAALVGGRDDRRPPQSII